MFRFTIRELVLLTLIVALGVELARTHWLLSQSHRQGYLDGLNEAEQWIYKYEGYGARHVRLEWNVGKYGVPFRPPDGKYHEGLGN